MHAIFFSKVHTCTIGGHIHQHIILNNNLYNIHKTYTLVYKGQKQIFIGTQYWEVSLKTLAALSYLTVWLYA